MAPEIAPRELLDKAYSLDLFVDVAWLYALVVVRNEQSRPWAA